MGGSVSSARWTRLKPLAALCAGVTNQLFNLQEWLENWDSWGEMGAASCSSQLHSLQAGPQREGAELRCSVRTANMWLNV